MVGSGLTNAQRGTLIDKLPDTANLALGAMLFGQFLGDRPFSWFLAGGGMAAWVIIVGLALLLGGRK